MEIFKYLVPEGHISFRHSKVNVVEVHRASRFGASTSKAGDGRPKK